MRSRRTLLAAAAVLMVLPPLARSDEPPAPVDGDLLEFLGSADSDDPEWNEYMASAELDEVFDRSKGKTEAQPAAEKKPVSKVNGDGT